MNTTTFKQTVTSNKQPNYLLQAWLIWLVASLFYSMEFFQRVSPSVMAESIMHSLSMGPASFAFITSLYFYSCAVAQIPVGYLLDRYRLRYLLAGACLLVSLGSFIFAISHAAIYLAISRILVGFGSAFAFIGVLKLSSNWFNARQYPLMVGLTNTLGIIGAIAGEAPYARLVNHLGWRESLIMISIIGAIISVLIFIFIRNHPANLKREKHCRELLEVGQIKPIQALKQVIGNGQTWLTAIYAGLMVAPIIALAELWSVPFLSHVYHLNNVLASKLTTAIFIGIAVGGPLNGYLVKFFATRKQIMMIGNVLALLSLTTIIYYNHISLVTLAILLFVFGFTTSSMLIAFTINKERHASNVNATVVGFTNMIILIFGALYQDATGILLKWFTPPGAHLQSSAYFHRALVILPITLLISLLLLAFIKLKD